VVSQKSSTQERGQVLAKTIIAGLGVLDMDTVGAFLFWVGLCDAKNLSLTSDRHHHPSWLAWTCDAIDFFSVSLSVTRLQDQFGKSTHSIVRVTAVFLQQ